MTTSVHAADATFRDALRLFKNDAAALREIGPTLETTATPSEPPRVVSSSVIEGTRLRAHRIADPPVVGFDSFLDGLQQSRVVHHTDGVPIVFGWVGAVVRQRLLRRMTTWKRPATRSRLYAPKELLRPTVWMHIVDSGFDVVDTTDSSSGDHAWASSDPHPFTITQRALDAVKRDREAAERQLAEEWCLSRQETLFIDGSIAGNDRVASASNAIGVIKSHRTLYVGGDDLRQVQSLAVNHRTSVIRVDAYHRTTVASWYLRVRDSIGYDPLWGLLRIETSLPDASASPQAISARADLVSRWILAELMPLSLPDSRWDKMLYGVHDCENFLKTLRT